VSTSLEILRTEDLELDAKIQLHRLGRILDDVADVGAYFFGGDIPDQKIIIAGP
jgi:hypothetical protein